MKGFIAAVVVLGVFCILEVSANKMCYLCVDCAEVSNETSTCNTTGYCSKVTVKLGGNTTVTRGCASTCTKSECSTTGDSELCCCDTDKCNGAGALTSALVTVMAPLLAIIYFTQS
ncbi:uncharacterized protein [Asterias amurensis]|uniref:uncharacterized protein n=1 Tax=Asterias amurensis TaxID=7602 RepID=UPI003AB68624